MMKQSAPKIGLALGSGGARGWAHIGVIDALEEVGLDVSFIAGTSMGALVGGVYAAGRLHELKEVALGLAWKDGLHYFSDLAFPSSGGLIDGKRIDDLIRRHTGPRNIQDLALPFRAVATDIESGREVVLQEGDVMDAIRASLAIPGILTPVYREGAVLVDGGLVNPIPVSVARAMGADLVIAVDVNYDMLGSRERSREPANTIVREHHRKRLVGQETGAKILATLNAKMSDIGVSDSVDPAPGETKVKKLNLFDVLGNSMRITETRLSETLLKISPADVLIRPDVGHIGLMEFHCAAEAIDAGYQAALQPLRGLAMTLAKPERDAE